MRPCYWRRCYGSYGRQVELGEVACDTRSVLEQPFCSQKRTQLCLGLVRTDNSDLRVNASFLLSILQDAAARGDDDSWKVKMFLVWHFQARLSWARDNPVRARRQSNPTLERVGSLVVILVTQVGDVWKNVGCVYFSIPLDFALPLTFKIYLLNIEELLVPEGSNFRKGDRIGVKLQFWIGHLRGQPLIIDD